MHSYCDHGVLEMSRMGNYDARALTHFCLPRPPDSQISALKQWISSYTYKYYKCEDPERSIRNVRRRQGPARLVSRSRTAEAIETGGNPMVALCNRTSQTSPASPHIFGGHAKEKS